MSVPAWISAFVTISQVSRATSAVASAACQSASACRTNRLAAAADVASAGKDARV
jgi:hypothetical protein